MLILGLFLGDNDESYLLGMGLFISVVSTVTMGFLTVGITSLAVNMGVIHADLKQLDPGRAFSGIGGLIDYDLFRACRNDRGSTPRYSLYTKS